MIEIGIFAVAIVEDGTHHRCQFGIADDFPSRTPVGHPLGSDSSRRCRDQQQHRREQPKKHSGRIRKAGNRHKLTQHHEHRSRFYAL